MPIHRKRILYQDSSFLAVEKLPGELVVKGAGRVDTLPLLDFLEKEFGRLWPLHRLDFETSGIVLFAKTKEAFELMKKKFEERDADLQKIYRCLVSGSLGKREGTIDRVLPARTGKGTVPALTTYRVLEQFPVASYVEADMRTGRHHQLRQHFAMIGHPLAADQVYGSKKFNQPFARQFHYKRFFLHAAELHFQHPLTGETVTIECELPRTFEEVLQKLRKM